MTKFKSILVREEVVGKYGKAVDVDIDSPSTAVDLLKSVANLDKNPQEEFWAMYLDSKRSCIGLSLIGMGSITESPVCVPAVFRQAILSNAYAIIVAHNHPSGDPTPSPSDFEATNNLKRAGEVIGINVVDHIIIGVGDGNYNSLREIGAM